MESPRAIGRWRYAGCLVQIVLEGVQQPICDSPGTLQILGATAFGYMLFGDLPDLWTGVGAAMIVASGLYIIHRERRLGA